MTKPLFTLVIPTRNRADVLYSAISTCLAQDDDQFQVIVSDNASQDDTAKVVASFADSRIRYIRPPQSLGMPEHWEFALSHAEAGFVSVLGDDDGLLPGCIGRAREILLTHDAQCLTWRKAEYHWPDHVIASYRNWLQVPMLSAVHTKDPIEVMRDVVNFTRTYTDLPCIYNSFVSTDLLDRIREKSGRLLPCINPDIYSSFALAAVVDKYVFSERPLSINAASRHSNGSASVLLGSASTSMRNHFADSSIGFDPSLVPCASIPVHVAEAAMTAKRLLGPLPNWPAINWVAMLELAAQDAERRSPLVFTDTLAALGETARRRNLSAEWNSILERTHHRGMPDRLPLGADSNGAVLNLDATTLGLRSVNDAARFAHTLLRAWEQKHPARPLSLRRIERHLPRELEPRLRAAWRACLLKLNDPPLSPPVEPGLLAKAIESMKATWDSCCALWMSFRNSINVLWMSFRNSINVLRAHHQIRTRLRAFWSFVWDGQRR